VSAIGSEFTNAFWMYVSRQDSFADRLPQLAHESFHAWNPHRMGLRPNGEPIDWFTEGFTDYYLETIDVEAHGDTAIEIGRYRLLAAGDVVADQGKYIVVWKNDNGAWKLHRDIWTTSQPAAVPAA
jgi:hypothetical protein